MGSFEDLFKFINNKTKNHNLQTKHIYANAVLKSNKQLKPATSTKVLKLTAGILAGSILLGSAILLHNKNKGLSIDDFSNETEYTETLETKQDETIEILEKEDTSPIIFDLNELNLETNKNCALTSDSVKNLSNSLVKELKELYILGEGELPPVVEAETLSSIFFCENGCKPIDTAGDFIGIGQIGKPAIQNAIDKINKLYNKAINNNASLEDLKNNYYVQNIVGKDAETLFELAKTDAKLCGALTSSTLSWISDSLYTAFGENKNIVIMSYNAGVGNMQNLYMPNNIIILSPDKKEVAIDLSKINSLSEKQLEKFNEAITYLIRVNGGSQILKDNPDADILEILEQFRVMVGKNNNYSKTPNHEQYNYAPNGVTITGIDLEMER